MAQKSKTPARASKSASSSKASSKAARPAVPVKASAKPAAKKPAAVSAAPSKKPGAAKAAVAKTIVKTPPKGIEMKKTTAASNAKKPTLKTVVLPSQSAPAAKAAVAAPKKAAAAPVAAARPAVERQSVSPARAAAALSKSGGQKLTAPVQPASPKDIAEKTAAAARVAAPAAPSGPKKPVSTRHGFKTNEFIVYPAHGVGRIVGIEEQEIAGMSLELFVITFEKEKLTLRVPTGKLESVGMRKLADDGIVKKAMETLKGRARVKRTMWSRRAQEYVAKINSGDLISIAEVVRDLYRSEAQPEQSYSERQLYEDALDRMARELAAVEKLDERGAVQRIVEVLSKSARGRRVAEGTEDEVKAA
jgi:CarD family transcriptional regulator